MKNYARRGCALSFCAACAMLLPCCGGGGGPSNPVITNDIAWVMTQDASNVFWSDPSNTPGGPYRVPKAGGASTTLVVGPLATDALSEAGALAVTATTLYWSENLAGAIFSSALP